MPSQDIFSYPSIGAKWIPFEWGWDVLTYSIFSTGGFIAISIFRTILICGIFFILFLAVKKFKIPENIFLIFAVILSLGILTRFSIRPHLISYLFFALIVLIFIEHRYFHSGKKTYYYLLPIIFLLWANMHMGVITGIGLFTLFVLIDGYDLIKKKDEGKKSKFKLLSIVYIISIWAMLINPHFIETYTYVLSHSQMNMLEQINEWKSPFSSASVPASAYNLKIYFFFLFSGLVIVYYSIKRKDYFPSIIYLLLAIYSAQGNRFITDFLILSFPFYLLGVNELLISFKKVKLYTENIIFTSVTGLIILFFIFSIINGKLYKDYLGTTFRETGFGESEKFFPAQAVDFIKREGIDKTGEKIFNNLRCGGYFIWNLPGKQNFIDSRNLSDSIYTWYKWIDLKRRGFEDKLDYYGIDYILYSTPYLTINVSEIERNIVSYLCANSDKWKLVFWDDKSFLFVKNVSKFKDVIDKFDFKYISPYSFLYNFNKLKESYKNNKTEVDKEIIRKLEEEPNGIFINDIANKLRRGL